MSACTAFAAHDHRACIDHALDRAAELCRGRGVRLTAQRRRVLELVWAGHRPVGAYELLEQLAADGARPAPPTVYRALEFLLQQGLVHRIEGLNAYVGCSAPERRHGAQFLICDQCRRVAELCDETVNAAITASSTDAGFRPTQATVEIHGLCERCRDHADG